MENVCLTVEQEDLKEQTNLKGRKANDDRFTEEVKHFYTAKGIRKSQRTKDGQGETFGIYVDKGLKLLICKGFLQKREKQRSN